MKRDHSNLPPKGPRVGHDGTVFRCPICKSILPGTNGRTFPFCSDRCRLVDLSNWLDGNYTVSRPIDPTDHLDELPQSRPQAPKAEADPPDSDQSR